MPRRPSQPMMVVSTHSRPKAAGSAGYAANKMGVVSTHSRPKAAGFIESCAASTLMPFQHTAARRRLVNDSFVISQKISFNTQPPEGGWRRNMAHEWAEKWVSTHSRPKAAGRKRH